MEIRILIQSEITMKGQLEELMSGAPNSRKGPVAEGGAERYTTGSPQSENQVSTPSSLENLDANFDVVPGSPGCVREAPLVVTGT